MNWEKIKTIETLPAFNVPVLLYEKKNGKEYAMVGILKSIDATGYHWVTNVDNSLLGIFNIFDDLQTDKNKKNKFNPTHWCEIEVPKEE